MAMTLDTPTLYPELREIGPNVPARGLHGYYRKTNGWISVGSTTPANRDGYEQKGFTFLGHYGQFKNDGDMGGQGSAKERDARGAPWNPVLEPWRLIFQKGGAKEFPVEQIIAYRWHLRPPYREVTFPQLQGVTITDYFCPECDKGVFSSTLAAEAAQGLRTHLTTGINRAHSYTAEDLRKLGAEEGIDFFAATRIKGSTRRKAADVQAPSLAMVEEASIPDLTPNEEVKRGRRTPRNSDFS